MISTSISEVSFCTFFIVLSECEVQFSTILDYRLTSTAVIRGDRLRTYVVFCEAMNNITFNSH